MRRREQQQTWFGNCGDDFVSSAACKSVNYSNEFGCIVLINRYGSVDDVSGWASFIQLFASLCPDFPIASLFILVIDCVYTCLVRQHFPACPWLACLGYSLPCARLRPFGVGGGVGISRGVAVALVCFLSPLAPTEGCAIPSPSFWARRLR